MKAVQPTNPVSGNPRRAKSSCRTLGMHAEGVRTKASAIERLAEGQGNGVRGRMFKALIEAERVLQAVIDSDGHYVKVMKENEQRDLDFAHTRLDVSA